MNRLRPVVLAIRGDWPAWVFPAAAVWSINRRLRRDAAAEFAVAGNEAWQAGLSLNPEGVAEVGTLYGERVARLRRLEDKVAGQLTALGILVTFAATVTGAGLAHGSVVTVVCGLLAFLWLLSGGLMCLEGTRARPLVYPDALTAVRAASTRPVAVTVAADRLRAIRLNETAGTELNNALTAIQRSMLLAVAALAVGGSVAASSTFGHDKNPAGAPKTDVSSSPTASSTASPAPSTPPSPVPLSPSPVASAGPSASP